MNVHNLKCGFVLVLVCLFLTGCGKQETAVTETVEPTAAPTVTEAETLPETVPASTAPDGEYPPLEFYGDDSVEASPDFTSFAGQYDGSGEYRVLTVDEAGNFELARNPGEVPAVTGQIVYVCKPEFFEFYAYDRAEEVYRKVRFADEQRIEIAFYGSFLLTSGQQELQMPETEFADFEGAWYPDSNVVGDCYILIDLYGCWSYFDGGELVDFGQLERESDGKIKAVGEEGNEYETVLTSDGTLTFDGRVFVKDA